jgi:hypothetical protein
MRTALGYTETFGRWFYGHMSDPTYQPEVIRVPTAAPMRWERWSDWTAGDQGE